MIRSSNQYSYFTKRLQMVVMILALIAFVIAAFRLDAHVDLHLHRGPDTEALEKEAEDKKTWEDFIKSEGGDKEGGMKYFVEEMA